MTHNMSLWQLSEKQAKQIMKLKDQKAKDRQIVLLCKTLKKALGGA